MLAEEVAVATVTYSNRLSMLEKMIQAVLAQGVRNVLVCGNGISAEVRGELDKLSSDLEISFGAKLQIICTEENLGSAFGYARVIEQAFLIKGVRAVWLLDDDNIPTSDCLEKLIIAHGRQPDAALAALRRASPYLVRAAERGYSEDPKLGAAFGFDVRNIISRFLRQPNNLVRHSAAHDVGDLIPVPHSPYSSILIPSLLQKKVGVPKEELILYSDDYEYTERLSKIGGLYLVPNAYVDDQDPTWPKKEIRSDILMATSEPNFRLYYFLRNAIWLDHSKSKSRNIWIFRINVLFMFSLVFAQALLRCRMRNVSTVYLAIYDALSGRLGLNTNYPLP